MTVGLIVSVNRPSATRKFITALVTLAASMTPCLLPAVHGAGSGSGAVGKSDAFKLESIPGSTVKRVILTKKAAERLGIQTEKVREQSIVHKQMVGGRIIPQAQVVVQKPAGGSFGGFGQMAPAKTVEPTVIAEATDQRWVMVTLTKGEWERLRKDKPARIVPLATRKASKRVLAAPSGIPPAEDMKRSMLRLYYKVPEGDQDLKLFDRVRVELEQTGKDEIRKVVPYSALYYDAKGNTWVYTNPKPLVFERQRVGVEGIHADLAVLTDGPPVGTSVVSTGAALLYGVEVVFQR